MAMDLAPRSWPLTAARAGAWLGLALGVIYAFGGLVVDWTTTGLNHGTALAFLALLGMPLILAVSGFVLGLAAAGIRKLFRGTGE